VAVYSLQENKNMPKSPKYFYFKCQVCRLNSILFNGKSFDDVYRTNIFLKQIS
jgi:hypothetical protein